MTVASEWPWLQQIAIVNLMHSNTPNRAQIVTGAYIVIAAVGTPKFVVGDRLPLSVTNHIDANAADDPSTKGYRLVGDVCYAEARQVASLITPVPALVTKGGTVRDLRLTARPSRLQPRPRSLPLPAGAIAVPRRRCSPRPIAIAAFPPSIPAVRVFTGTISQ